MSFASIRRPVWVSGYYFHFFCGRAQSIHYFVYIIALGFLYLYFLNNFYKTNRHRLTLFLLGYVNIHFWKGVRKPALVNITKTNKNYQHRATLYLFYMKFGLLWEAKVG